METHVLARLQPWVRSLAAQKVFADARPKAGPKANKKRMDALSEVLRRDDLEPITENEFHNKTEAGLRSVTFTAEHRRLYHEFCGQLFAEIGKLWLDRPEKAFELVRQRWTAWTTGFGRHRGREHDKLVLDELSYESAAAWRRCYSACWTKILPALKTRFSLSRISYRFLEYWHQQVRRDCRGEVFDLFHGHVLGLHPAGSIFVQTPLGRELLGAWLEDAVPPPDLRGDQFAGWAATLPTATQVELWADRIAAGRDEFPADLREGDRLRLAEAVRRRLRQRLLRHVARAIVDRLAGRDRAKRATDD